MNPKILVAFVGGAALAGALAFFLTKGSATNEETVASSSAPSIIERPVENAAGNAADVAAGIEAVRPLNTEAGRRGVKLPKPAAVVVKKGSVGEPGMTSSAGKQTASTDTSSGGVVLPPFSSSSADPIRGPKEDLKKAEILRSDPVTKTPARTPETITLPAGTNVTVRMASTLNSEKNLVGESFSATLDTPLVINDVVLAERGARVEGTIVELDRSGRVKGTARLSLALTRITLSDGQRVDLKTDPWERMAESSTKSDAAKIGIGAALGAAIGAITGGGKGAAVGGASGAGAGTGVVLATRGKAAQIDVETKIPFRLSNAVTVTEKIN